VFLHTGSAFEQLSAVDAEAIRVRDALCHEEVATLCQWAVQDVIDSFISSYLHVAEGASDAVSDPLHSVCQAVLGEVAAAMTREAVEEVVTTLAAGVVEDRRAAGSGS
jgi:hypothetical protein